eukprot:CAMPEP_0197525678 /NCGR_PEP_ID=MMETSP1318-20131121/13881_1 /TAXON_ID=552666 /ORGANISM="Partenskyella glossopodia, Strain RCC365" /LENGTH=187 /DNA_ID=CAMNT_0043079351 /DNA_START=34 /DNA_END=597 /DNA_ORIENTATION=+
MNPASSRWFPAAVALAISAAVLCCAAFSTTPRPLSPAMLRSEAKAAAKARVRLPMGASRVDRRQMLLGCGAASLMSLLNGPKASYAMDSSLAKEKRAARRAAMKEKFGDPLSKDEERLLSQRNEALAAKEEQKEAFEKGTAMGMNKDVASLKSNKNSQRESIRARLIAQGGGKEGSAVPEAAAPAAE